MGVSVHHHPALRVSDVERAARFYIDALGGHYVTLPFTMDDEFAETVMDGPPGVAFRVCMIGFDEGIIELFEFIRPVHPMDPVHPTRGNLLHIGVQVDDVAAALARVEEAGGKRLWPEINPWGTANVVYVTDPDGNILELIDAPMEDIARLTLETFPDADPATRQEA